MIILADPKTHQPMTSYKKGLELENEFSDYIKANLGYDKIKIRFQVPAKNNNSGTNVDIIGQRLDDRGRRFSILFKIFFAVFAIFIVFGFILLAYEEYDGGLMLIILGIIFEFGGVLAIYLSNRYNVENIWVECKNLKTKVNITQVKKTIDEVRQYKASGDKQYKFIEVVFVSTSGFVSNALEHAIESGLHCYIKEDGVFKKIDKWN